MSAVCICDGAESIMPHRHGCPLYEPWQHDTYVFDRPWDRYARRWFWNCPCGAEEGPFKRRMDADEAAGRHQNEETVQ